MPAEGAMRGLPLLGMLRTPGQAGSCADGAAEGQVGGPATSGPSCESRPSCEGAFPAAKEGTPWAGSDRRAGLRSVPVPVRLTQVQDSMDMHGLG